MSDVKEKAAAGTAAQFNDEDGEISQSSCAYSTIMHDGKQSADRASVTPAQVTTGVSDTEDFVASTSQDWPEWNYKDGIHVGRVCLDWMAFTLETEDELDMWDALRWVAEVFGELTDAGRGFRGYAESAFILATGRVAWSPQRPEMGVHIALSAQSLGQLARQDKAVADDVRGFLVFLRDSGAKFTRLDIAVDDRRGVLSAEKIIGKLQSGEHKMSWRSAHVDQDVFSDGITVYLGSRSSSTYARVYNKRAERIKKGHEDPGPWVRSEVVFKKERAELLADVLIERGVAVIPAVLRGKIEFLDRTEDANKSRWPVCGWWKRFLGYVERMVLSLPTEAKTLEDVENWIKKQVAPSLSTLLEWHGGEFEWLMAVLANARSRRPTWQRAALKAALAGGGAS